MDDATLDRLINRLLDQEQRAIADKRQIEENFMWLHKASERMETAINHAREQYERMFKMWEDTRKELDALKA